MSTLRAERNLPDFVQDKTAEIMNHVAWYDDLTGSEAELLLRGEPDMTYLLRRGEKEEHFYLTYVKDECYFTHIPFTINHDLQQWFYMNSKPRFAADLARFIPDIMHAEATDCIPLVPFKGA